MQASTISVLFSLTPGKNPNEKRARPETQNDPADCRALLPARLPQIPSER